MSAITGEMLERLSRRRRFAIRTLHVAQRLLIEHAPAREVSVQFHLHLSRVYAIRAQVLAALAAMNRGIEMQPRRLSARRPLRQERAGVRRFG